MKAEQLKPGTYWVGAVDWAVRDFHGYVTPNGTTYNNYLIMDEQPTLIDTVKHDFIDISVNKIKSIVEPGRIKNIVINHIEPDHASGLAKIMQLMPEAVLYMTEKGRQGIERYFDSPKWDIKTVKTGDTLSIGKRTLMFLETPMLHWPDSMMTFVEQDKLLFSQDAFGQHLASSQRFDDEFTSQHSEVELDDAVMDYYANILMPFGSLIKNKLAEVAKLGLDIDMIAPDHGVIWRENPARIMRMYLEMAEGKARERAVIIFDTMWQSTQMMTMAIAAGIREQGLDVSVLKLRATPTSIVTKEFWKARGCLIGSPTLNNTLYPSVGEFMVNLKGLRPKNRLAGAYGSFGWGGGAVKTIYEDLKKMGLEIFEPGMEVKLKPSEQDIEACRRFGEDFAGRLREYHATFEIN